MSNVLPKICFIAHQAYPTIAELERGHIGGVEWQTTLMAKWFANKGYDITMLTWDLGQKDNKQIAGVKILKICREQAGLRGLRFFHPKWTGLIQAMKRANAGIYYQNCADCVTGQAALWCKKHNRKFVYSVANDVDVNIKLPEMKKFRDRILYKYGLKNADKIIVQTKHQQELLKSGFGRDSVVIAMPCIGPTEQEFSPPDFSSKRILWIGRICRQKRPDKLIEIAKALSMFNFDLVGPVYKTEYAQKVFEQAKQTSNITVHGPVPRQKTSEFYKRSACLICTSDFEGFPNTFLEAWSFGLPIISTFDPDNVIQTHKLGFVAKDIDELAEQIKLITDIRDLWEECSRNARNYYISHHSPDVVIPKFERVFSDVVKL